MRLYENWLQLFADGGDGGGASAAPGASSADAAGAAVPGVNPSDAGKTAGKARKNQPLNVAYGIDPSNPMQEQAGQAQAGQAAETQKSSFEDLIKGEYKEDFDKRVQEIISKRFKANQADKNRLDQQQPLIEAMKKKYGTDNIDDLLDYVELDDEAINERAAEEGVPNEYMRKQVKLEREKERFVKAEQKRQQDRKNMEHYAYLHEQGEKLKAIYPSFDLDTELQNEKFLRMTAPGSGIDLETAYYAMHHHDIMRGGMAYATQQAAQKISNAVQANAARPTENGLSSHGSAEQVRVTDPRALTKEQREDVRKRVRRGEKIVW